MLNRAVKVAAVQAEPVWLDMAKTTDKVIAMMSEAADNGAEFIGFPETFIPGYPWWIWLDSPAAGMAHVPAYHANSPAADGPEMARIAEAAGRLGIAVSLGYSERAGGSLYMGQAMIDAAGTVVKTRRKLKPTHVERSVFGEGDGSDLVVHDFGYGNVGGLCCWEYLQPLSKYAMYAQNEDIHCAAWPTFSLYKGAANALGHEVNNAASLMYAVEGGCFVLAPCGVIGDAGFELFCDTPAKEQMLQKGGGFTRIYGPDGSELAEPIPEDQEGIMYAECDPALQAISKSVADPAGHYSRPDVTRLLLNPAAVNPVVNAADGPPATDQAGEPGSGTGDGELVEL
ncbi:MAG: carbon-nitrogen hydrolase family protein [Actinomycetota bacterium]